MNRRSRAEVAADRAAILAAADGTRTTRQIVAAIGGRRGDGEVYADIVALRRQGHRVPIRPRGQFPYGAFVYRHFDADGRLLYIGCTCDPVVRIALHRAQSRWYEQIARIEMVRYPDPTLAIEAEADAIRVERPPYNTTGKPRGVSESAA